MTSCLRRTDVTCGIALTLALTCLGRNVRAEVPASSSETCRSVDDLLNSAQSDLPPLPPRNPDAEWVIPRVPVTSPRPVRTSIDLVVATPGEGGAESNVASLGWSKATASAAPLAPEVVGAVSIDSLGDEKGVDGELAGEASAWMVIESPSDEDSEPLVDGGVFRCEAVFDGVPVMADNLAPTPLTPGDAEIAGQISAMYALAPLRLDAPAALETPSIAPSPSDVSVDADGDAVEQPAEEPLSEQRREQLAAAAAELFKPLNAISLTTGLEDREPPDLAKTATPDQNPRLVWGEPWPDIKLAAYRYTNPFMHRPLYFEQPNFERCGTSCGFLSPYVSAGHFAGSIVTLPLHMVLDCPCRCVPTLGDCPSCHSYGFCPHRNRK